MACARFPSVPDVGVASGRRRAASLQCHRHAVRLLVGRFRSQAVLPEKRDRHGLDRNRPTPPPTTVDWFSLWSPNVLLCRNSSKTFEQRFPGLLFIPLFAAAYYVMSNPHRIPPGLPSNPYQPSDHIFSKLWV